MAKDEEVEWRRMRRLNHKSSISRYYLGYNSPVYEG